MQDIKSHQYSYYIKNAVVYNLIFTIIAICVGLLYLLNRLGIERFVTVFKNPSSLLIFVLAVQFLWLVGMCLWFVMFTIPYITIGKDCLTYKESPFQRRKFIKYKDIASYGVSFWFFTLNLTSGKKVRMRLYGVSKKKEMIKRLEATLAAQTVKSICSK